MPAWVGFGKGTGFVVYMYGGVVVCVDCGREVCVQGLRTLVRHDDCIVYTDCCFFHFVMLEFGLCSRYLVNEIKDAIVPKPLFPVSTLCFACCAFLSNDDG